MKNKKRSSNLSSFEVRVLNVHSGYAGPSVGSTIHTNVIVSKWNGTSYVDRRNYHVSANYTGGAYCWNIWDSATNREYNNCHTNQSGAQSIMQSSLGELIGIYIGHNYQAVAVPISVIVIVGSFINGFRVSLA